MPTTVRLDETGQPTTTGLTEAEGTRRRRILIISPGQGSSGNYPADVLERDGPQVIRAGTHMMLDHPGRTEERDRPERSVRDLAAVLETDAVWDPQGSDGPGLYAEAKILPHFAEMVDALAEHIGVSVRGQGEIDGDGTITSLTAIESVDFVTRAGRGGRVLEILESARVTESLTANELRDALEAAARDRWSDDDTYVWVRDYSTDEGWCVVEVDDDTVYQIPFTVTDDDVSLGAAVEVEVETTYVPVEAVTEALREARTALAEARNVGQWFESLIHLDFTRRADEMAAEGRLTRDERIALSSAIGDGLEAFVNSLTSDAPHLYDRDIYTDPDPTPTRTEEADVPTIEELTARLTAETEAREAAEAARDAAVTERDEARTDAETVREANRTTVAESTVRDAIAHVEFPSDAMRTDVIESRARRAVADADGDIDTAALTASVRESYPIVDGATVTGLGEAAVKTGDRPKLVTVEDYREAGLSESAAKVAAVRPA